MTSCQKIRPGTTDYAGRQGFRYLEGVSREGMGAQGLCMHLLTIPPGGRARATSTPPTRRRSMSCRGRAMMAWGEALEHRMETAAGEMLYIPADVPHLPWNPGPEPVTAVIARTDPHEQESVVLLPHLDALVP
jgi:uncharacterized RmlC-like cupin family protein